MFNWKLKATNAIYLEDATGQEGRPFKSRFLQAGLVKYDFGVCLLKKETIDKFVNTFLENPVIINHLDDIESDDVCGTVQNVWFSAEDGWYWCSGILTNPKAIELIENGYNVSCQYRITEYADNDEGKLHNANPYDKEILDGVFEHLAIVENPRYEDAFIAVNAYIAKNNEFNEKDHPRDDEGKFMDRNGSSFYNDKTKTIELKGDELGSSDDEIRENAFKYYKEKYQGKKFNNPNLNNILFSRTGFDKLKTNSADIDKLKAIPALKDIIEKGNYIGEEQPSHECKDGIIKFHRINHDVSLAGKKENMSVLIGEDRQGNRFYNLNNKTYTAENSSRVERAKGVADEEFSINIIAYNSDDFNPNITINKGTNNFNKVFDYIRNTKGESMDNETKGLFSDLLNALKARNEAEEKDKKECDEKAANEDVDKRKLIDEVGGILKGKVDEELWRTIIGKIEKVAYDKSEAGTADNKAKNADEEEDKKDEAKNKCRNEDVDKRDLIRQIMAIAGKHEDNEDVRTIAKLAEKLAYDKSEAGTADNKCKNSDEEKLYEELKEKVEKEAENKKASNSLDALVNKLYSAVNAEYEPSYISPEKGIELGELIYGRK